MKHKQIEQAKATGRGNNLIIEILKAVAVFAAVTVILSMLTAILVLIFKGPETTEIPTLAMLWGEIFGIGSLLLYCRFVEKRPLSSMGFVRKGFITFYLKGICMGFGIITSVVIVGVALGAFRFVGINRDLDLKLLLYLGGFLIQGMYEEVMCRGYFMISAARKNSIVAAIIANSLLFTMIHIGNNGFGLIPIINLTLFGVLASVYMLKTENIWGVGALHSTWNFSLGCIYGLSVSGMEPMPTVLVFEATDKAVLNGSDFGPEGGVVVTIVLCVELLALLWPSISRKNKNDRKIV